MSTDIAELMLKAAEELRKIAAENTEMKERIFHLESALKKSPGQTDQIPSEPVQEPVVENSRDCPYCYHTGSVHCGDVKVKILANGGDLGFCSNAQIYGRRTPPAVPPKNIRVHGWVWKDKQTEDDCYIPSYTPAQHVAKGELLALVDPADLHEPLQNTKWF